MFTHLKQINLKDHIHTKCFQIIDLENLSRFLPKFRLCAIPKFQKLMKRNYIILFVFVFLFCFQLKFIGMTIVSKVT